MHRKNKSIKGVSEKNRENAKIKIKILKISLKICQFFRLREHTRSAVEWKKMNSYEGTCGQTNS